METQHKRDILAKLSPFGERVTKARRENSDLSEAALARKVGIDPSKFNRWVNAESDPPVPVSTYFELADALGITFFDLLPAELRSNDRLVSLMQADTSDTMGSKMGNVDILRAIDRVESSVMTALSELLILRRAARDRF